MTLTPFEIYAIMKWSNLELQRRVDSKESTNRDKGLTIANGEYLSPTRLAKMCAKELRRRKNVGLYIEEANEWDRFTPDPESYEEEELDMEERNQLLIKQFRKAPRRPSLLNIGKKR